MRINKKDSFLAVLICLRGVAAWRAEGFAMASKGYNRIQGRILLSKGYCRRKSTYWDTVSRWGLVAGTARMPSPPRKI